MQCFGCSVLFICGVEFIFHFGIPSRHDNLRVARYTRFLFVRLDFSSEWLLRSCLKWIKIKETRNTPNSNGQLVRNTEKHSRQAFVCLSFSCHKRPENMNELKVILVMGNQCSPNEWRWNVLPYIFGLIVKRFSCNESVVHEMCVSRHRKIKWRDIFFDIPHDIWRTVQVQLRSITCLFVWILDTCKFRWILQLRLHHANELRFVTTSVICLFLQHVCRIIVLKREWKSKVRFSICTWIRSNAFGWN